MLSPEMRELCCKQRWDSHFSKTGSLTTGLTNNTFSHYQSPEANHAGWPNISARLTFVLPTGTD